MQDLQQQSAMLQKEYEYEKELYRLTSSLKKCSFYN